MKNICIALLFVTISVPNTWTIYVPERAKHNNAKLNGGDYLAEEKTIKDDLKRIFTTATNNNNNQITFNDDNETTDKKSKVSNEGQKKILTANQAKTNAHHLLPTPRKEKSYDIDDDVVVSANSRSTVHLYEHLEAQPTSLAERQQHKLHNNDVLTEENNNNYGTLQHTRQRRHLSDFFIAPNTRWCGRGNTANGTYNHLGGASMADKCCRTHDHCKYYIPAMSNRYDLFNYRPYTLSHCNCDRRFRTCLKMANDEDANTIGKLFFNLVQTQCFVFTKKEVTCQQRAHNGTCLKEHIKQKAYLRNNKKY